MFARERASLRGGRGPAPSVRDYPVEPGPFRCQISKRRRKGAQRARRTLPNLLATRFRICVPTRLFNGGRQGPHSFLVRLLDLKPEDIRNVKVETTIVGGKVV